MASLVAVRCPTCGAGLRIDPGTEVAICTYCNTSAFVKTRTRPATRQVLQQRVPVIDLSGGGTIGVIVVMGLALLVAGGAFAAFAVSRSLSPTATEATGPKQPGEAIPSVAAPAPAPPPRMKVADVNGLKGLRDAPDARPTESKVPRGMKQVEVDGLKILRPDTSAASSAKSTPPLSQRSTTPTVVSEANLAISGGLEKAQVSAAIRKAFGRFHSCYAQALALEPSLTASSTVRFVIETDGAISSVSNVGSQMPGPMKDCVMSAYRGLHFPAPTSNVRPTVLSKLTFSQG